MAQSLEKPTPKRHISPFWREALQLALLAILYAATVQIGLLSVIKPEGISAVWPASGVALSALLITPKRRWAGILVVLFAINMIGNVTDGASLPLSLGFAVISLLEALLSALALTYFRKTRLTFETTADVFALAGVVFFINGFTAMLSGILTSALLHSSFLGVWRVWWVSDGLGMILITPMAIVWRNNPKIQWPQISIHAVEFSAIITTLIAFSVLVFGPFTNSAEPILHEYMLFPLLIWLAFRFNPRSMVSALLLAASIAFYGTLQYNGIFAYQNKNAIDELIHLQIYLNVMAFSGMLLSAMMSERKQGEESIKKAEADYRNIVESAPIGFFQSIIDGQFKTVNPKMAQIFGYGSPAEMIENVQDVNKQIYFDETSREKIWRLIIEHGQLTDSVNQYRRKDGSTFWAAINARIVKDQNGQPLYLEGFLQDINHRIKAEQMLRESEERYQNILKHATIGFIQSSPNGRILAVNPYMASIFGYDSPDDMIDAVTDIGTQMHANPAVRDKIAPGIPENELSKKYTILQRRKDGSTFWVSGTARMVKDKNNQPLFFEGFVQDIDERVKAEKALEASHQFVQATMDSLSAHICVLDEDGTILAVNKAWMDFASQNPPIAGNIGVGVNYLTICDNTTGPDASMARAFAAGIRAVAAGEIETFYQEYPCHAPYEERWFMGRVLRFADETKNRVVIAHENITERKQIEDALRESEASLKLSQQMAHVGHWIWEASTNNLTWSDEMYRIFGLDPVTFHGDLNKVIEESVHPDDRENVIEIRKRVFMDEKAKPSFEHRIILPDQSIRTVWVKSAERILDANGKTIKVSGVLQDITERKQAEDALRESEANLKLSQKIAHVGSWTWDTTTNHVTWSDEMYRIFGLDPLSFDGDLDKIIVEAVHPDDREKVIKVNQAVITEEKPEPLEYRIVWPDQSIRTVWAEAGAKVTDNNGKIIKLSGIVQDITERKRAEDALRESEQFAISVANNVPGLLAYWTPDLHCGFANSGYLNSIDRTPDELENYRAIHAHGGFNKWFGFSNEQMRGISIQELMTEEMFKESEPYIQAALRGEAQQFERTHITPNGEPGYTWVQYTPYRINGKVQGFFALVTDITQIKRDQERLRISEEKWRSLFAILPVGISLLDAERRVIDFNPALEQILGITADGLHQGAYTHRKYLRADGSPMPESEFPSVRVVEEQTIVQSAQMGIVKEDNRLIWVEMSAAPLALPGLACVVVTTDVTRRKQTEQALQQANDRLSLAQHAAGAGLWDWDMTSNSFNWSPELLQLFGLAPSTKPDADLWFSILHEQDRQHAKDNFKNFANREDTRINDEYRIVRPDSNEVRWVNVIGDILRDAQGKPVHTAGIFIDITARKQAEQALQESERNIRTFFETMTEGMALNEIVYDENNEMVDYRILDVNPTFYTTADFSNITVIGSLASDLYGMPVEIIKTFWQQHKDTKTTVYTEMFSPLNHRWFYIATSPFLAGKFVTSFLDITLQKEREEQLIHVNQSLSMAQQAAGAGLWDWDMTQDFYNWSPELFQLFGLDPNIKPTSQIWLNSIHEEDRQRSADYLTKAILEHTAINNEYRILTPSGEIRWINALGKTTYSEDGQPQHMAGICIDITARKHTENALIESEARLKGIVVSAMDGIVMIDKNQYITLFNQSAEKMFGLPASSVIGQPLDFILPQNKHAQHKKHIDRFGETGITTRSMSALMDISAQRANGENFPIEASISQFIANGEKFYTAILRDITERKQMEENLRASLLEKEALLKEVHHRVKNNLQIVSSLLSMQANNAKDEKVTVALEESKNRVRAMALIHEKLYRSDNLEYIQAEEYIPELTSYLTGSLIGHERAGIQFDLQIAPVTFDIGKAIPCGMIITELVSNALKYAFPVNKPGVIKVHLDVDDAEKGKIRLMVSDNGVGLPPQIDYNRPDTLGLELVSILSRQLKGKLQVIREPGTTFILVFQN